MAAAATAESVRNYPVIAGNRREKPEVAVMLHRADATFLTMTEPGPCGHCRVASTTFVNRGGRTWCFRCDNVEQSRG
jgi:hypothetical protein